MPQATLRVLDGALKGQAYPILFPDLKIGRGQECKIRPENYNEVSRVHARLYWNGAAFVIEDQDSRNGVLVDGKKIQSRQLADRAVIQLGDFVAELRMPSGPPEFTASSPALPDRPDNPKSVARPMPTYAPALGAIALLALVVIMVFMRTSKPSTTNGTDPSGPKTTTLVDVPKPIGDNKPPPVTPTPDNSMPDEATLKKTKDAVVLIAHRVGEDKISMGSGFCSGDGRTITTNRHVVTDTDEQGNVSIPDKCIVVFFCGTDHEHKVDIAADQILVEPPNATHPIDSDLAVIKLPEKVVEPLPIGDTTALKDLQRLWVVGFPHGLLNYAPNRQLPAVSVQEHTVERLQRDGQNHATVLQMGGSATHGNSGGPVINAQGEVVGVLQSGAGEGASITYAIPSDNIKELLQSYEDTKHHVGLRGISGDAATGGGR